MSIAPARPDRRRRVRARSALGAGPWLVARRLRWEPGSALALFVLVGASCFLFAALPRLFNAFADDGLRHAIAHAPQQARNIREIESTRIAAGARTRPLANVAERAAHAQQALPTALRELIGKHTFVVTSPRYAQSAGTASVPGLVRYLSLRAQSGVDSHVKLIAGHLPRLTTERVRAVLRPAPVVAPTLSSTREVPIVQVALSTSTARELQLHVGDRLIFTPSDVDVSRIPIHDEQPLAIEVAGLFAVKDPSAAFWFGDSTLDRPEIQQSQDVSTKLVYGQALVLPEQYATVLGATEPLPLNYEYRYFVDADRLDAGGLPQLRDAVARVDARYAGAGGLETRVDVGLGPVLDQYEGARSQAETLLAVAAIGLLACALANLGLLGVLAYDRRRTETGLARTRGASPQHVLAAQAVEGLLIAVPAGIAGWAVAVLTIHARGSVLSAWLALAIVVGTIVLLVAAIASVARRPLHPHGRDDVVLAGPSPGRLAVEGLIVLAAALGVYLLRRRGLEASRLGASGAFDPYLAGVPVLLGLAFGLVALRLYPWPIAGAARFARRRRGLALHLGLSRAVRQPDATSLPLLVLVLALAIASFSAMLLRTLETGQQKTGWRAVGADLRIDAPEDESLSPRLIARLDSIGYVARAYVQEAGPPAGGATPLLVALDIPAYERVIAGTPTAARLPRVLGQPPPIPSVVPALISTNWPEGGSFQVTLPNQALNFIGVAERAGGFPGIPAATPFAVVSLAALQQAGGTVGPNRLYLSRVSAEAVRRAVTDSAPGAEIRARSEVVRSLRASPLVESVLRGFRAAIGVAVLYAGVAVALMALIAARSRARDLALVRTMGGSQRDTLVLAAVELTPFVVVALVLGIGLGVAIPHLIGSGLDLAFFTGNASSSIVTPWLPPVAFAVGLVLLVGAAVLIVGARTRRASLGRALRIGER